MNNRMNFRVWDIKLKEMGYQFDKVVCAEDGSEWRMVAFKFPTRIVTFADCRKDPARYEISQCTGFKDIHGTLVFEQDIVKVYDAERSCNCENKTDDAWCDDCCYICTQDVKWLADGGYFCDEETGDYCPTLNSQEIVLEVIGNMHETPDKLFTDYRIYLDGDKWCATLHDFTNLQESAAGFGDTPTEAIADLKKYIATH